MDIVSSFKHRLIHHLHFPAALDVLIRHDKMIKTAQQKSSRSSYRSCHNPHKMRVMKEQQQLCANLQGGFTSSFISFCFLLYIRPLKVWLFNCVSYDTIHGSETFSVVDLASLTYQDILSLNQLNENYDSGLWSPELNPSLIVKTTELNFIFMQKVSTDNKLRYCRFLKLTSITQRVKTTGTCVKCMWNSSNIEVQRCKHGDMNTAV